MCVCVCVCVCVCDDTSGMLGVIVSAYVIGIGMCARFATVHVWICMAHMKVYVCAQQNTTEAI